MIWQTKTRTFDLSEKALVMGVLNLTTDSFSDGGDFLDLERAVAHALAMADAGAEIIDVGAESTRPGSLPVDAEIELQRVLPVIERLAGDPRFVISIDTMKPQVAQAAIEAGAGIINDVSGLRNPAMLQVVKSLQPGAIAMHMQGCPRDMQLAPHYSNVSREIRDFFRQTFATSLAYKIDPMCLAFDPGIGFGKTLEHNLELLRDLPCLRIENRPLVLGVSRKSFIGKVLGSQAMADRQWPTIALSSYGRTRGANVVRVHEVGPNLEALRMTEAILSA